MAMRVMQPGSQWSPVAAGGLLRQSRLQAPAGRAAQQPRSAVTCGHECDAEQDQPEAQAELPTFPEPVLVAAPDKAVPAAPAQQRIHSEARRSGRGARESRVQQNDLRIGASGVHQTARAGISARCCSPFLAIELLHMVESAALLAVPRWNIIVHNT